jgi:hypothetical protein
MTWIKPMAREGGSAGVVNSAHIEMFQVMPEPQKPDLSGLGSSEGSFSSVMTHISVLEEMHVNRETGRFVLMAHPVTGGGAYWLYTGTKEECESLLDWILDLIEYRSVLRVSDWLKGERKAEEADDRPF